MEWLKKLLKANGMEDAAINAVIDGAKKEMANLYVDKESYNKKAEKVSDLETSLNDVTGKLKQFTEGDASYEKLKEKINTLTTDLGKEKQARIDVERSHTIKSKLGIYKPKNTDDVLKFVDTTKITFNDKGEITGGLDDQMKSLVKDKSYMFDAEDKSKQKRVFIKQGNDVGDEGEDKHEFNMNDFIRGRVAGMPADE